MMKTGTATCTAVIFQASAACQDFTYRANATKRQTLKSNTGIRRQQAMSTENEKVVRDPMREALQLAHDHMRLHIPQYSPGWNVHDTVVAALQSQVSNTDGWVMVPVEPTEAMVEAAELDACGRLLADDIADAYSAMLSAAQKAKP
jgi:hypothetical protein